jgi:hypothetical protein
VSAKVPGRSISADTYQPLVPVKAGTQCFSS